MSSFVSVRPPPELIEHCKIKPNARRRLSEYSHDANGRWLTRQIKFNFSIESLSGAPDCGIPIIYYHSPIREVGCSLILFQSEGE